MSKQPPTPSPDQDALDILDELHQVATDKGLSHYKIASMLGVSQPNVNRVLTGAVFPRLNTFFRLCRAIGVKVVLKKVR